MIKFDDPQSQSALDARVNFGNFTGQVVDKYLAGPAIGLEKYNDWSHCAPQCTGQIKPGYFSLPLGYHGNQLGFLPFRLAFCDLANQLEQKIISGEITLGQLVGRMKSSVVTLEPFTVDFLAEEEGLSLNFSGYTFWDIYTDCPSNNEIMDFLSKFYLFEVHTIYQNFGTTLQRMMAYGDLQVTSWVTRIYPRPPLLPGYPPQDGPYIVSTVSCLKYVHTCRQLIVLDRFQTSHEKIVFVANI